MFKLIRKQEILLFFAARQYAQRKPRKLNMRKWVLTHFRILKSICFEGQIETKYNRISILVL